MFKSLFSKKTKNEPTPAENLDENGSSEAGQEEECSGPVEEVLNLLYEGLDPGDPEQYAVAVAEVDFLWARFQQLMPGPDNTVSDDILSREPFVSNPFLKQIWKTIPTDGNGNITFPTFFGVVKWWESADQEVKLRGIFKLLNKASPVDADAIQSILQTLDSDLSEESANRKANLLISHLDDKNQGYIDEDQWVQGMSRLSDEEVNQLTRVYILPPATASPQPLSQPQSSPVAEEMLIAISSKIGEKDWKPLAHKLGFTDREIKSIERHFPNRSREQNYQMLKRWREKNRTTKQDLEFALRECGMDDALSVLANE